MSITTDLYWKAMMVETELEAQKHLELCTRHAMEEAPELTEARAREIQLANIGYWTGYLIDRDQKRLVLELFGTEHPIFGRFEEEVSMDKALKAGIMLGSLIRESGHMTPEAIQAAREIIRQP